MCRLRHAGYDAIQVVGALFGLVYRKFGLPEMHARTKSTPVWVE